MNSCCGHRVVSSKLVAVIGNLLLSLLVAMPMTVRAQEAVALELGKARHFSKTLPAGDFSGLAWLGGDRYAVVDDKSAQNGFYVFRIAIDTLSGRLLSAHDESFVPFVGRQGRSIDAEAIAYVPRQGTLLVASEAEGSISEYTLDGRPTGREVLLPPEIHSASKNYGLESLSYNDATRRLWTCTEGTLAADGQQATAVNGVRNRIRLLEFDEQLQLVGTYAYEMDAPRKQKPARSYAMGVSELCALDDGSLLVLEREFRVPKKLIGASVEQKLYRVVPKPEQRLNPAERLTDEVTFLDKQLMARWRTKLNLTRRNLANYEGMCLGPRLSDGRQVLVLISDSQHRYRGVLKDWIKVIWEK